MFIITIYKDSRKVKINRNYVSKWNLYLYFLVQQNLLISIEKYWCQQDSRGVSRDSYIFLDLLWVRYNCAKFHHCRIRVTDFREGRGLFALPLLPLAAPKKPILNRVKIKYHSILVYLLIYKVALKNVTQKQSYLEFVFLEKLKIFCHFVKIVSLNASTPKQLHLGFVD